MPELIRIKKKEGKLPFIFGEFVKRKFANNQNFLCAIVGPTGTGKSLAAIRICEIIDKDFSAKRIVFTPKEFISLIKGGQLKPGSCIVFDETGVAMNRRNWYSEYNKMMNAVLQTFRFKRIGVFFTLPDLSFMDSGAVKLLHAYMETNFNGIKRKEKVNVIKVSQVSPNPKDGKVYWPWIRVQINRETFIMNKIKVSLPSPQLLKDYEKVKSRYADDLYVSYFDSFGKDDGVHKNQLNANQQKTLDMLNAGKKNIEIAEALGMATVSYISNIKKAIIKKGYRWKTKAEIKKELSQK
jgi:ABC-type dipeptide/oligopeptide/nickel transport system ATPase component